MMVAAMSGAASLDPPGSSVTSPADHRCPSSGEYEVELQSLVAHAAVERLDPLLRSKYRGMLGTACRASVRGDESGSSARTSCARRAANVKQMDHGTDTDSKRACVGCDVVLCDGGGLWERQTSQRQFQRQVWL